MTEDVYLCGCGGSLKQNYVDDIGTVWFKCDGCERTVSLNELEKNRRDTLDKLKAEYEVTEKIKSVWRSPKLLEYLFVDLNKRVKYDMVTKTSVLFSGLSAYLPEPLNLFEKGVSGVGKSYNAIQTLAYFPESDIWFLGGMSPKALVHQYSKLLDKDGKEINLMDKPEKPLKKHYRDDEEFKDALVTYKEQKKVFHERLIESYRYINIDHKIFVFLEAPDFETMRMLYPILSHDKRRIEYRFVDKSQSGLRTVKVVIEGWVSAIFLTTDKRYVEELATRSFTVSPEETTEKIEASNQLTNLKASLPWECELETEEYYVIKALIENIKDVVAKEKVDVVIPFLGLYKEFPKDIPRDMRDFSHFIQFLKAFTILHLYQRPCLVLREKKFVLATSQDVVNGYAVFKELFESTRTGTEQRVLNFYYEFMLGKEVCYVSGLTTEYNSVKTGKSISDFTIRYWLNRLNEIGYVEKKEDDADKRRNIYIPLVKKKQELRENTLNSENHVNLDVKLKKSFEEWKTNIRKVNASYYKNIFENEPQPLEEIERSILGSEKIISIFDTDLFLIINKAKKEQETSEEPKSPLIPEINVISHNSENLVSKTTKLERLSSFFEDKCIECGVYGRMDFQVNFVDGTWGLLCEKCGLNLEKQLGKGD